MMKYSIRPEVNGEEQAIRDLTGRAFAPMPFADETDQELPGRFRRAGKLRLSLVAQSGTEIVGHVALTQAIHHSSADNWFALGPISVEPAWQRQGIGTAMIAEVRRWLVANGAAGCILVGDTNYYSRHGFMLASEHCPHNEPPEHFMVLKLKGAIPSGRFAFDPLFYGDPISTADSPSTSD